MIIDANAYIHNFNIVDPVQTTRWSLLYAYLAGYFIFMLKVLLALLTLFILILIIRVIVSTVIHIFTPQTQSGGGVSEMRAGALKDHYGRLAEAVHSTMRWILCFVISKHFIIIFLIIIPIFLYFSLLAYVRFYNRDNVTGEERSKDIMETHHQFLMMFMTTLMLFGFIFCVYLYFQEFKNSG